MLKRFASNVAKSAARRSLSLRWGMVVWLLLLSVIMGPDASFARVLHDEATDGDLSGDHAAPTDLGILGLGSNTVSGTSTAGAIELTDNPSAPGYPNVDADIWKLAIASGQELRQIILSSFAWTNPHGHTGGSGGVPGGGAFFGVQVGNEITASNPPDLTGGGLIGILPGAQAQDDVLDDLGSGTFSEIGVPTFNGPLEAGTYTFWYQEGPTDTSYTLDFQISNVPEPTSISCLGTMAILTLCHVRPRRKTISTNT